jgi:hypothetical protein
VTVLDAIFCVVSILRKHHDKDEIIAAALGNLSGYLCRQDKMKAAKPHAEEALKIFRHVLGAENDYTKSAFNNLYIILKELGLEEEVRHPSQQPWRFIT